MKTTATNRKIRTLIQDLTEGKLIPNPSFQRRLVWTSAHKLAFLETVLLGFPFPEIYIAAGEIDETTAQGTEMLVDGQQRVSTLWQYFKGTVDVRHTLTVPPYEQLTKEQKLAFLEYEVVVRDLGSIDISDIKEVFRRINSTKYSLNAMEIQNARYEGAFKDLGDKVASFPFFEKHNIFTMADIRRMHDIRFALTTLGTMLVGYFNRDSALEDLLRNYGDEFPHGDALIERLLRAFDFIDHCNFDPTLRVWNKADMLTLLIEVDRLLGVEGASINVESAATALRDFYRAVDESEVRRKDGRLSAYYSAAVQATNDKMSRMVRGEIIEDMLRSHSH